MKTQQSSIGKATRLVMVAAAGAVLVSSTLPLSAQQPAGVAPPGSSPHGLTYAQWAGDWWRWFMQLPLTNRAGFVHPAIDCAAPFDISEGQTGDVWFLAAPFQTCTRSATIPAGTSLFFQLLGAEWSKLEGPGPACSDVDDTSCQLANASFLADLIANLTCTIDNVPVNSLDTFRFQNPQITFFAPCPCWIFKCVPHSKPAQAPGAACGPNTSTGDGYFIFLDASGLPAGTHSIRYSGGIPAFGLSLDMTYVIAVQ